MLYYHYNMTKLLYRYSILSIAFFEREVQVPGHGGHASSGAPAMYRGAGYNVQSNADDHASLLASAIKNREHRCLFFTTCF